MRELLLRIIIGGCVVSSFATLGLLFKPKTFAGLFGAAPSVALATLGLSVSANGRVFAATEARSMMAGAVAFFAYVSMVTWLTGRENRNILAVTSSGILLWLSSAFGLWYIFLR